MKIGIALPQYGNVASPESIARVAMEADEMGLASLWVSDRLLLPTKPLDSWDGEPWPEIFATVYDPIEMLTYAAAKTKNVQLGTSVMSGLFHNPVLLARRFATLDRFSDGRVIVGLGQGDFRDEFQAANVPRKRRGRGFEEFVLAVRAIWGPDPVRFSGEFYHIPESKLGPKPVQNGGPPLLLGAFEPKAIERAARIADGILPSCGPKTTIQRLEKTLTMFHEMVRKAGRDPNKMMIPLRCHSPMYETASKEPRGFMSGTPEQVVADDLPKLEKLGFDHVYFDMNFPAAVPINVQLKLFRRLMELL